MACRPTRPVSGRSETLNDIGSMSYNVIPLTAFPRFMNESQSRTPFHSKRFFDDGGIVEISLWRVPAPVPGSGHDLKYSLFHGREGQRLVGYDNERGKGDHKHLGDREEPDAFVDVQRLIADFLADVRRVQHEQADDD